MTVYPQNEKHESTSSKKSWNDLSRYDFNVPGNLIAQKACLSRDHSRLLVRTQEGRLEHKKFHDLLEVVPSGSVVVLNETKVIPCKMVGHKRHTGGRVEVLLTEVSASRVGCSAKALVRTSKALKVGVKVDFPSGLTAEITGSPTPESHNSDSSSLLKYLKFNLTLESLYQWLDRHGSMPLPPYINRKNGDESKEDFSRYQTIYGSTRGSIAAPTAGLHFTSDLIEKMKSKGVIFCTVTLHVGLGTFMPIRHNEILKHKMHKEKYMIPQSSLDIINQAIKEGRKIIGVGTTTLRCLESFYRSI